MNDNANPNGGIATMPDAERMSVEQWRAKCAQLETECDGLQRDLQKVTKERDEYLRAVYALLPPQQFQETKEELIAQRGAEPTLQQLLAEMQQSSEK